MGGTQRQIPSDPDAKKDAEINSAHPAYGDSRGLIGGYGLQKDFVYLNIDGNPAQGSEEPDVNQIQAVHNSSFIPPQTGNVSYGNYADFHWVEDNKVLEGYQYADYRPGEDGLRFRIPAGNLERPTGTGANVGDWMTDTSRLPDGAFVGTTFHVIDIISNVARYTDMDTTVGEWSQQQSAGDYDIYYSADNQTYTRLQGSSEEEFFEGWTNRSKADDFVRRFLLPEGTKFIEIRPHPGGNHDGNTQIDAIIAATLPNTKVMNFEIDGGDETHKRFIVDYEIEHAAVDELTIQIMASPDGVQHGPVLKSVTYGQTNPGNYRWTFEDLVPPNGDHYLIAVIDPDDEIDEWNEGDNQIIFEGGTFYSPTTDWVYTHDSDHNYADLRSSVQMSIVSFVNGFALTDYPLHAGFFQAVGLANVDGYTFYSHLGDDSLRLLEPPQAGGIAFWLPVVWYAGDGNDEFHGSDRDDVFHGGAGNDVAFGASGADTLYGGDGDDILYGDRLPPSRTAGTNIAGNDILEGGDGYDKLYGEDGATTVRVGPESTDSIYDDLYAESGAGDLTAIDWQGGRSGVTAILSDRTLKVLGEGSGHVDFVQDAGGWSLKRNGAGTLDLHALYAGQAVPLTLESGTTRLMANLKTTGYPLQTITAIGGSRLEVHSTQNLNELHVIGGSGVVVADHGSNALVVNLLEVQTASGSYIDVRNNDLIVHNGAQKAYVRSLFISGHNGIDANLISLWNGAGIRSSWVRERNLIEGWDLYGLGGIKNGDLAEINGPGAMYSTFTGQAVDANSILVKTTYSGDANLNGLVSMDDYGYTDSGFYGLLDPEVYGWLAGDFDHDGDVDLNDYLLIDNAYYMQLGQM